MSTAPMLTFVPQDEAQQAQFTVLTDRTQGGASLNDGEVELMVGEVWSQGDTSLHYGEVELMVGDGYGLGVAPVCIMGR